ncbi:MAG: transcriptional regulator [Burkholderiaceae bacterium]
MNLRDISAHWVALHEALRLGLPIGNEAEYERALAFVAQVFDAGQADGPLAGLLAVMGDRIREYEDRVHPWPNTATAASVLAALMREHGLRQGDLPEVGSQGVVSEVLAGKRTLNVRQIAALAKRFGVAADVFLA